MASGLTRAQQVQVKREVEAAVQAALTDASQNVVATASKPDMIGALRKEWRKSGEHKAAQVKRFLSALVGILTLQVVSDVAAHKTPFTTVHDARSAWFYLFPFAYIAWRQVHPAMTASMVDSAPGATIVPAQLDVPVPDTPLVVDPAPVPPQADPVDPGPVA